MFIVGSAEKFSTAWAFPKNNPNYHTNGHNYAAQKEK